MNDTKPKTTVLAALVHERVKQETFDSLADLVAVVKGEAATLGIPYNAALVTEALAIVARTRRLVRP